MNTKKKKEEKKRKKERMNERQDTNKMNLSANTVQSSLPKTFFFWKVNNKVKYKIKK